MTAATVRRPPTTRRSWPGSPPRPTAARARPGARRRRCPPELVGLDDAMERAEERAGLTGLGVAAALGGRAGAALGGVVDEAAAPARPRPARRPRPISMPRRRGRPRGRALRGGPPALDCPAADAPLAGRHRRVFAAWGGPPRRRGSPLCPKPSPRRARHPSAPSLADRVRRGGRRGLVHPRAGDEPGARDVPAPPGRGQRVRRGPGAAAVRRHDRVAPPRGAPRGRVRRAPDRARPRRGLRRGRAGRPRRLDGLAGRAGHLAQRGAGGAVPDAVRHRGVPGPGQHPARADPPPS